MKTLSWNDARLWARAITAAFVALLCAATLRVDAEEPGALKSAAELAETLKARIGQNFEIPTTFSCDVLTAEQRDTKVILFKSGADWNDPDSVVWEWDPLKALPGDRGKWFGNVSDCKPVNGLSEVLVAASGGGVARVRLSDKKVLFYGMAGGNTHSIAMLPDGNIVAASSTGAYLSLFAVPENCEETGALDATPIAKKIPYFDAHGLVWDAKRNILWALGGKEIAAYEYVGTKKEPDLKEIYREELKGAASGGHDLYPAPGYDALMTTGAGVSVFDPNARTFTTVSDMKHVKSISLSPEGVTLMQRAVVEWWSETIFYGDAANTGVGTYSGAEFYKARWFAPNEFSDGPAK